MGRRLPPALTTSSSSDTSALFAPTRAICIVVKFCCVLHSPMVSLVPTTSWRARREDGDARIKLVVTTKRPCSTPVALDRNNVTKSIVAASTSADAVVDLKVCWIRIW